MRHTPHAATRTRISPGPGTGSGISRSSRGRVAIHRANGSWDCLLDIPKWDYHWASPYLLAAPVEVRPGDLLYVECHWDNTAGNQVPVNGAVPAPRDLHWATDQEMCAGLLFYTETWP